MVPVAITYIRSKLSQDSNNGQGSDSLSQYGDNFCQIVVKSDFKKQHLWTGHVFAARSCCNLDLQCSDPNVARDTATQYGDQLCEIVLKWDFK